MKRIAVAVLVVLVGVAAPSRAEDKKDDPTGTWKWTVDFGGQTREQTLKLKLDGGKLTGALVGRNGETNIEDAKFKDGELSFKVVRERNGQKFTSKYQGKLSGDTIKGKIETERDGETQSREWSAKREKK